MEDVLEASELPEEMIVDDEIKQKHEARQRKYLNRYYKQEMYPEIREGANGVKHTKPGRWVRFLDGRPDTYINKEAHIRRLITEGQAQLIEDPRPGATPTPFEPVPGLVGPAARPPEPSAYVKKVEALEKDMSEMKQGMSQILALLQAKQEPSAESPDQTAKKK